MATQNKLAESLNGFRKKPGSAAKAEASANNLVRFFELLIEIESNEHNNRNTNNSN